MRPISNKGGLAALLHQTSRNNGRSWRKVLAARLRRRSRSANDRARSPLSTWFQEGTVASAIAQTGPRSNGQGYLIVRAALLHLRGRSVIDFHQRSRSALELHQSSGSVIDFHQRSRIATPPKEP